MVKKIYLIIIGFVILALIIAFFLTYGKENYVNLKSCVSLSPDQTIKAYEVCNNLMASDPSGCQEIIESIACPIKGVAMNAMLFQKDASNTTKENPFEFKV
jgi:hypothetical protein